MHRRGTIFSVAKWPKSGLKVVRKWKAKSTRRLSPPRGTHTARVDEKGRLKLPVAFQEFFGKQKLFVTTLDGRIARIYTIPVWMKNEALLFEQTDDPEVAERMAFRVNKYGADTEVDAQGRILLPPELRRLLELENQPVWVMYFKDGLNVYSKAAYEEVDRSVAEHQDDLTTLRRKGFK